MATSSLEVDVKKINENLKLLAESIQTLETKLDAIETNTRDEIKKMVWFKKRVGSVDVYVRVSIVSVSEINTVMQQFTCEFYLSMRWEEPNLCEMVNCKDEINWSDQWEPGIYFVDLVQIEKYERNETLCEPKKAGGIPEVMFYYHVRGTFKEVLDITHFPFDYQPLTLTMTTSWTWDFVNLQKDYERDDNIRTWNFTGKNEWQLESHVLTESIFTEKEPAASDNIFPIYRIKMHAFRKYAYYIYNVALIMDFISALAFTSYTVEASNPGERIQISLTLFLTSVALKYVVNSFVPQVPYPTLLDKFIICCMAFQFLVAVENGVAAVVHIFYPKSLLMFERISFGGLLLIFLLIHIVFCSFWFKYTSKSKHLSRQYEIEYRIEKERTKDMREYMKHGKKVSTSQFNEIDQDSDDAAVTKEISSKRLNRLKKRFGHMKMKRSSGKIITSSALQYRI